MTDVAEDLGSRRVLTVPNAVTLARLGAVPVFLWLLFGRDDRALAAAVLGGLYATDWVDGYLARRLGQVSEVGKVLDPVVDRVVLIVGVGAVLIEGAVPAWVAWASLSREVLISVATVVLAGMGAARIDVQWAGKAGTFGVMFAFPFFLGGESDVGFAGLLEVAAWLCVVPGLVLGWYAAARYFPLARRALAEGRAEPDPTPAPEGRP